jgi:lysophospholipase L1-like esterase
MLHRLNLRTRRGSAAATRALTALAAAAALAWAAGCAALNPPSEALPLFTQGARIVFQGDSITDGHRARNAAPGQDLGSGYAFIIAAKLGAELAERRLIFVNRGIAGNEITDLAGRWQSDAIDLEPDVLSILVGVNGIGDPEPADAFEQEYERLLADTVRALPHVRLILCEPFGLPAGPKKAQWAQYYPELERRVAVVDRLAERHHATIVHFQRMFEAATSRAPPEYWISDGIHPTYAGHQLMATAWIRAVRENSAARAARPASR